jgi:hypothetical protein
MITVSGNLEAIGVSRMKLAVITGAAQGLSRPKTFAPPRTRVAHISLVFREMWD